MKPVYSRIALFLLSLIVPFFLVMTSIRLLITPLYPQIEYRMPYFPPDPYGFTLEDRLQWSRVSIEYLLNDSSIDFLANQRLNTGQPLFNERELSHMLDVKILVQRMVRVWWVLAGLLLLTGGWAWRSGQAGVFWRALARGGVWTLGAILVILVAVAVSFTGLFTLFHRLFFTGDTWLFYWTDSLIRLFPLEFWRDGFIAMGIFTVLGAAILIFIGRRFRLPA